MEEFNIKADDDWFAGEDKTIQIKVVDADGAALDMTGMTLRYRLLDQRTKEALATRTTGSGITLASAGGTNDEAVIDMPASTTEDLPAATYLHRLDRTDSGSRAVLSDGYVELRNKIAW